MENFRDKTVIITGGSEGIGAATARKFADAGANLVLVARGEKNLKNIAEELRAKTNVRIVAMDVSDPEACVNLFKKAEFEFGSVHVLINNFPWLGRKLQPLLDRRGRRVKRQLKAKMAADARKQQS